MQLFSPPSQKCFQNCLLTNNMSEPTTKEKIQKLIKANKSNADRVKEIARKAELDPTNLTRRSCLRHGFNKPIPKIFLWIQGKDVLGDIDYLPSSMPLESEVVFETQALLDWLRQEIYTADVINPVKPIKLIKAYAKFREIHPNTRKCWFTWTQKEGHPVKAYASQEKASQDSYRPNVISPREAEEILQKDIPKMGGTLRRTQTITHWKEDQKIQILKRLDEFSVRETPEEYTPSEEFKFSIPKRSLPNFVADLKELIPASYSYEANIINQNIQDFETYAVLALRFTKEVYQWKWWVTNAPNKTEATRTCIKNIELFSKLGKSRVALCLTIPEIKSLLRILIEVEI